MRISWLLGSLLAVPGARANVKGVFAHFMVSNTALYSIADWQDDISKAAAAHIDGFALNMAVGEATNGDSLANAFTAANNLGSGFKLFFSFDYAGNGLWNKTDVISLVNQYASNSAYYRRGSQPLVSTFEGPAASADWPAIKSATGCFFIPSWSSLGAGPAWALGTADGLFSWAAWPDGPNNMSTFTDHSYLDALGGKPYMMGVSPWFYTNLPGFRKNWMWRGDTLWFDRWVHVMSLQPEYVEIITWNDYGESHHIGPLRDNAYVAFDGDHGKAPFNYALGKSHDGWRAFLPFLIDMAKSNTTSFNQENVVAWYRENPNSACGTGGTTGNTASQLQQIYAPGLLAQDMVFYAALLGSAASVSVSIGGQTIAGAWSTTPSGGAGLYRGSVSTGGRTGNVVVTVSRSGSQILQASGDAITTGCVQGIENWNANVIAGSPRSIATVSPLSLANSVCTSGFGDAKYLNLCSFACQYGYCPSVCTCTSLGAAVTKPSARNVNGCPAPGMDSTYLGLCSFSCNYGYCPSTCQVYPADHVCTAPNPQAPPVPVCVAGMADGPYADLCSFSCYHGFCPPQICTCTQAGTSSPSPPALTQMVGGPAGAADYGLCQWSCQHGNCPSDLCTCSGVGCSGQGQSLAAGTFFEFPSRLSIAQAASDPFGQACYLQGYCSDQSDTASLITSCNTQEVKLGWDQAGCKGGKKYGRSICCPTSVTVRSCMWQGGGLDCNGQCHKGEVTVRQSKWGDSGSKCNRGTKALCCGSLQYLLDTNGCRWTKGYCNLNERLVLAKGLVFRSRYCCPSPPLLHSCVWRGGYPDCADAKCLDNEVAVATDPAGDGLSCWWSRKKVACCTLDAPAPPQPESCDYDWCSAFPDECAEEEDDAMGFVNRRGVLGDGDAALLDRRSASRKLATVLKIAQKKVLNDIWSRGYPSRGPFVDGLLKKAGAVSWWAVNSLCDQTRVVKLTATTKALVPAAIDTEHPLDLQVLMRFMESCVTGVLPGGKLSRYASISANYFNVQFGLGRLPAGLPLVSPTSPDLTNPLARVFEAFGSNTNQAPLLLADRIMNQVKGNLIGLLKTPLKERTLSTLIESGMGGNFEDRIKWLSYMQRSIATFDYLRQAEVNAALVDVIASIRVQLAYVERYTEGGTGLVVKWDEYIAALIPMMQIVGQEFVTSAGTLATGLLEGANPVLAKYDQTTKLITSYMGAVGSIGIPIKITR